MRRHDVRNEIALEFFMPPGREFLRALGRSIRNFNIEMSPESHDPAVRAAFGKRYGNQSLEESIGWMMEAGCRRLDLFFMVGLPGQDPGSVQQSVQYAAGLVGGVGRGGRLLPMLAPLAPFIDPGSLIFEEPRRFGYRILYRTLAEHRQALLMPSWKHTLNYETRWMDRAQIVRSTYEGALSMVELKARAGLITRDAAIDVRGRILRAIALAERLDGAGVMDPAAMEEARLLSGRGSICDKRELQWPLRTLRLRPAGLLRMLVSSPPRTPTTVRKE
jgi:hypothetical protein